MHVCSIVHVTVWSPCEGWRLIAVGSWHMFYTFISLLDSLPLLENRLMLRKKLRESTHDDSSSLMTSSWCPPGLQTLSQTSYFWPLGGHWNKLWTLDQSTFSVLVLSICPVQNTFDTLWISGICEFELLSSLLNHHDWRLKSVWHDSASIFYK